MDEVKSGLQYIFQTRSKTVFCVSGTGHAGLESTITNLVQPHETLLIASNGVWGQRATDMAKRQGFVYIFLL